MTPLEQALKPYPLAAQAYGLMSNYLKPTYSKYKGCGDDGCDPAILNIVNLVEETIDGTDIEKQATMIATMYRATRIVMGMLDKPKGTQFDSLCETPEVKTAFDEIESSQKYVFYTSYDATLPMYAARAVTIAGIMGMMGRSKDEIQEFSPDLAKGFLQGYTECEEATKTFIFPSLNAPKLEACWQKCMTDQISLLKARSSLSKSNNSKPKGLNL